MLHYLKGGHKEGVQSTNRKIRLRTDIILLRIKECKLGQQEADIIYYFNHVLLVE